MAALLDGDRRKISDIKHAVKRLDVDGWSLQSGIGDGDDHFDLLGSVFDKPMYCERAI
jgi:hypothetical protein